MEAMITIKRDLPDRHVCDMLEFVGEPQEVEAVQLMEVLKLRMWQHFQICSRQAREECILLQHRKILRMSKTQEVAIISIDCLSYLARSRGS